MTEASNRGSTGAQEGSTSERDFYTNIIRVFVHQLTGTASGIAWALDLLTGSSDIPPEKRRALMESVRSQAVFMQRCIENLAWLARPERDAELAGPRPRGQCIDLLQLATAAAQDIEPLAALSYKKIRIDPETFGSDEAKRQVLGDPNHLRLVLGNLLDNAIKYSDRGTVVDVTGLAGERRGIKISSVGLGIPEAEQAHIFDMGYRGKAALEKNPSGSGIGLYIARSVLAANRGTVEAESEGRSATFTVTLPAAERDAHGK